MDPSINDLLLLNVFGAIKKVRFYVIKKYVFIFYITVFHLSVIFEVVPRFYSSNNLFIIISPLFTKSLLHKISQSNFGIFVR